MVDGIAIMLSMLSILGMVSSLDEGVGTIADALEKSGHMDNTIFIFMSDVCFSLNLE